MIIGIDEVGRGPLAGPVIACACFIPPQYKDHDMLHHVKDSKKLLAKKREEVSVWLREHCPYALGEATVEEIDTINILQATFLAMERAFANLCSHPLAAEHVHLCRILVDGNQKPKKIDRIETIIGGDASVKEIAAASIIAKVHRDAIMQKLAEEHPHYGWHSNAGYGAKIHMDAIKNYGVTIHHRRSFAPIREYLQAA